MTGREPGRRAIRSPTSACWRPRGAADGAPGVRPIVLRDVGPQGIGLLISSTSPKWEPLASGRYELLLLWLTIRRQYRVRGTLAPMPEALVETLLEPEGPRVPAARPLLRDVRGAVDRRPVARAIPRGDRRVAPAAIPRPRRSRGRTSSAGSTSFPIGSRRGGDPRTGSTTAAASSGRRTDGARRRWFPSAPELSSASLRRAALAATRSQSRDSRFVRSRAASGYR